MDLENIFLNNGASDAMPIKERLREYYGPGDFVTVKNIDHRPLTYIFVDPSSIEYDQPAPHLSETRMTKPPQRITMEPGEIKLCPAFEADSMLENLIKQITASGAAQREKHFVADWSNGATQKEILKDAFLGKRDLISQANETLHSLEEVTTTAISSEVEQDLALEPAKPQARIGRPRKTQEA